MNIWAIRNYTDQEKLDLLNWYIDFMRTWEDHQGNYDLYCSLENNKRLKAKFLRFTVPYVYDHLDYCRILKRCLVSIQENCEKIAYEYPSFYMMSALVGALHCYGEFLSPKKIISRWSQILLNIY